MPSVFLITKGVFIWRKDSPLRRASPLCQDPVSQLKPLTKIYFCLYERRASPPRLDLAIGIWPRRAVNFPNTVNTLKRAGPPRRASKSNLRTYIPGIVGI